MIHIYNIAAWNANGLLQRIKEVEVFLNTQKIDVLLVSETHFTEQNYVNIPNYITYATNHPDGRAHAGSAIIIRKCIKHHELPKYETDHIQATIVSIEDWDGNLTISTIYCPPSHKIKPEQLNALINGIFPSSMESRADRNDPKTWKTIKGSQLIYTDQ
jgi:exonuclease III